MAMAGEGSFLSLPLSRHTSTNIEVVKMFLAVDVVCETTDREVLVRVGPA